VPEEIPTDVEITFAGTDALRLSCDAGRIELRLSIAELKLNRRRHRDLTVRVSYRPQRAGRGVELFRDGPIRMASGPKLTTRSQIVLRGLFASVFTKDGRWAPLASLLVEKPGLADVAITQFDIEDGWIAAALGPAHTIRVPAPVAPPADESIDEAERNSPLGRPTELR
jgi:hypothetical protein